MLYVTGGRCDGLLCKGVGDSVMNGVRKWIIDYVMLWGDGDGGVLDLGRA